MLVAPFTFFRGSAAVMAGPSVAIASYLGSGDAFDRGVIGARRDM